MRLKILFLSFLVFMPLLLLAQANDNTAIDSMIKEVSHIPDSKPAKGVLLGDIGMAYNQQKDHSTAIGYYTKALKVFTDLGNENGMARIDGDMGSAYLGMVVDNEDKMPQQERIANLHKSIDYLEKCMALCNKNGYPDVMNTFYSDLSVAVTMLGKNEAWNTLSTGDENNVKIAATGIGAVHSGEENTVTSILEGKSTDKEKTYYIIAICALMVVLIIVCIIMLWIYRRASANHSAITTEKKKAEEMLLNILPERIAAELRDKGMVIPLQYDNVSVILTDFAGFTTAAERFSPKQLVGELHACFKAFDGIMEKLGIEKIKTVGDAYLAAVGVPVADPAHAIKAISAAIKMRDFMIYRKTQLGDATFTMRIGVHSGTVVGGIVGVKKFAFDIWGDTVNLAARMEQNCEPGKINISQSTYDLVKDKFHCVYRGEISAKNKGMLKMYYVEDQLD